MQVGFHIQFSDGRRGVQPGGQAQRPHHLHPGKAGPQIQNVGSGVNLKVFQFLHQYMIIFPYKEVNIFSRPVPPCWMTMIVEKEKIGGFVACEGRLCLSRCAPNMPICQYQGISSQNIAMSPQTQSTKTRRRRSVGGQNQTPPTLHKMSVVRNKETVRFRVKMRFCIFHSRSHSRWEWGLRTEGITYDQS